LRQAETKINERGNVAADKARKTVAESGESHQGSRFDPAVSIYDLVKANKAATLNRIPVETVELHSESRLVMPTGRQSPGADRIRYLRMRLHELQHQRQLRSIAITSPLPDDGKSTIALNLASALAESRQKSVLLIEADLHQPALAKVLAIPPRAGLADCIEEGTDPLMSVWRIEPLSFYFLQAGHASQNPTDLLQSGSMPRLLERLIPFFDWILIDSPPILPLTDALTLSRDVDGTVLVVRAGKTPRETVEEAVEQIGPGRLLGVVLNAAEGLNRSYAKYTRYYRK
jgi:capsular exopolysaccharide synthesis family protein